jgi:4-aminobutyrate aminotransferase-like enzyme
MLIVGSSFRLRLSIRFAPPLVIEEEDLLKAIKLIEESLVEIDTVSRQGHPPRVSLGAD